MVHLVVLHHGLWGNASHMEPVLRELQSLHKDLLIANCEESPGTKTYNGIDYCGDRVLDYIKLQLSQYKDIDRISMIGYSLGGLILRYCVGRMFREGMFETIEPINFITIATPNLGVRKPSQYAWNRLLNNAINFFGTRVGPQLTVLITNRERMCSNMIPLCLLSCRTLRMDFTKACKSSNSACYLPI